MQYQQLLCLAGDPIVVDIVELITSQGADIFFFHIQIDFHFRTFVCRLLRSEFCDYLFNTPHKITFLPFSIFLLLCIRVSPQSNWKRPKKISSSSSPPPTMKLVEPPLSFASTFQLGNQLSLILIYSLI